MLSLDAEISANENTEDYQQFLAEKQKEDEAKAFAALVEMQKKESEKASDEGVHEGPVKIGYKIKEDADFRRIEQIIDEERRIAIEGFVFDAEVKELRSGRSLLTFKVTDYTSSILVKMFSRDKEDAVTLTRVKKGMWVRAQGSIQNDTFVRDLVMIANDINEISKVGRLDRAPEGEKLSRQRPYSLLKQQNGGIKRWQSLTMLLLNPFLKLIVPGKRMG
jgi:DNA polymerase-3 subunit alpha (Gram-positive type)